MRRFTILVVLTVMAISANLYAGSPVGQLALRPLVPITDNPLKELSSGPFVKEGNSYRQPGLVTLVVARDFNTGTLRAIDADVQLIQDSPGFRGERNVFVRVRDSTIDGFVSATTSLHGVRAVSKACASLIQTGGAY